MVVRAKQGNRIWVVQLGRCRVMMDRDGAGSKKLKDATLKDTNEAYEL